jgi:hypothetical protein
LVLLADGAAHPPHRALLPVEPDAVVKHKVHIVKEALEGPVFVVTQLVFNGPKVHRLLDDHIIVRDAKLVRVYRLVKDPGL